MGRLLRWIPGAMALLTVSVNAQCDPSGNCTYFAEYNGRTISYDFHTLCNSGMDYTVNDTLGHTFKAQICGFDQNPCIPMNWNVPVQSGRVVQFWGDKPYCNETAPQCVDERTGKPVCCTANCQVLAYDAPVFRVLSPGDPTKGVELFFTGPPVDPSNPFMCPMNPVTGQPYPLTVHMQFFCNASISGAQFTGVTEGNANPCDYTLAVETDLVCTPTFL